MKKHLNSIILISGLVLLVCIFIAIIIFGNRGSNNIMPEQSTGINSSVDSNATVEPLPPLYTVIDEVTPVPTSTNCMTDQEVMNEITQKASNILHRIYRPESEDCVDCTDIADEMYTVYDLPKDSVIWATAWGQNRTRFNLVSMTLYPLSKTSAETDEYIFSCVACLDIDGAWGPTVDIAMFDYTADGQIKNLQLYSTGA